MRKRKASFQELVPINWLATLFFTIFACSISIIALKASFGENNDTAIIIVSSLISICFGLFGGYAVGQGEEMSKIAKKELDNILHDTPNFTATESYITNDLSFTFAFIAVDENEHKIIIGGSKNNKGNIDYKIIGANEIMGVELTVNGKGLLSSSVNKNILGMAAVGGLLFGGAGAIVGAISGSKAKSKITEISLRIALDNIKTPYIGINFISAVATTISEGSNEYHQILQIAQKWYGIINIIIEREKRRNANLTSVVN